MAFCTNCGASADGAFCPKCGTKVGEAGPGPTAGAGGAATAMPSDAMSENVAGALCYILGFISAILFIVMAPYNQNPRIRFHAFQSLFYSLGVIAIAIALIPVFMMMPWGLRLLLLPIRLCLSLFWFGLWLYLLFKTYNGDKVVLPIIGPMAEQQANTR